METSTRAFSVTLFKERELAHFELDYDLSHSQHIVRVVQFLLQRLGIGLGEITAAYAGIGPGSFTGLRIGLSFVNTLSQVFHIPLLGVSSLDLLAFENSRWYTSIIPFIRSRKHEVYTALYRGSVRRTEYLVLGRNDFLKFIRQHAPECVVAGNEFDDILPLHEDGMLPGDVGLNDGRIVSTHPSSRTILKLSKERGLTPEHGYLNPLYIHGV